MRSVTCLLAAISSYITLHQSHIYSQGGPTGEIHAIPSDPSSRGDESDFGDDAQPKARSGFGEKIQEMVYVPEGELQGWDKTNKALVCDLRPCMRHEDPKLTVVV